VEDATLKAIAGAGLLAVLALSAAIAWARKQRPARLQMAFAATDEPLEVKVHLPSPASSDASLGLR